MSEGSNTVGDVIVASQSGPLSGEVIVPGAKNSVLKLMAATLLADGRYLLTNAPVIVDVVIMADLLMAVGLSISFLPAAPGEVGQRIEIVNSGAITPIAPFELADRIRASVNLVGPLLGRCGEIDIALPGGDDFGGRPIDMHLRGLEAMGATFDVTKEGIIGRASRLQGADIDFDFPSVGATENIVMAAVVAEGVTTLRNAAREPEIVDLCNMLRKMGCRIEGIGTSTLTITGVEHATLQAVTHEVVTDRVQAATYIAAVAMCGGTVHVGRAVAEHMGMMLSRFTDMGIAFDISSDGITATAPGRLTAINVATLPYPGVATDYKPLIVAMLSVANGVGIVTENLYPGRFRYVEELRKLGADITIDGHHASVRGVEHLTGATVVAPDIRAGAALVVAGLAATGITEIGDVFHIDRGYDDIVGRLASLGASITRIQPQA
ncbi:MAG: UDP-N-acetylglucosamine 1-carboxyvinyltransferase [Actinobacteria bacterium]|nr:UDP-N-acetylglucosamine 1-carboxyvinyltransferase [Actinomycetota bacterium]